MANHRVRVGHYGESEKSIGVLADFFFCEKGNHSASRLVWFPKSLCILERVEVADHFPEFYLTAPEWLLKTNDVKYEI